MHIADSSGAFLLNEPFQCCVLPSFIQSSLKDTTLGEEGEKGAFLMRLKNELLRLKFYEKNNDLYQFHQVIKSIKINTTTVSQ